jgi:hypothetical protein
MDRDEPLRPAFQTRTNDGTAWVLEHRVDPIMAWGFTAVMLLFAAVVTVPPVWRGDVRSGFFGVALAFDAFFAYALITVWLARTRIFLEQEQLIVEKRFFVRLKRRSCRKENIRAVHQRQYIPDRTSDLTSDDLNKWNLIVETDMAQVMVLERESLGDTAWLGQVIAHWCGKPYIGSEPQTL